MRAEDYDAVAAERDALKQMLAEAEARGMSKERERCVLIMQRYARRAMSREQISAAIREGEA